jgi:type IV pilus assembly protein PilX
MTTRPHSISRITRTAQRGFSLLIVLMILAVVSMLGVAAISIASMSERSARNDRNMQVAWQSAEAALVDAELELFWPVDATRRAVFAVTPDLAAFVDGCGNSADNLGLCALATAGTPAWLSVDFDETGQDAHTVPLGRFTERVFQAGGAGLQPAKAPRYVIELIRDPADRDLSRQQPNYLYRVTAMGFGPRADIQAVVQMVYRI